MGVDKQGLHQGVCWSVPKVKEEASSDKEECLGEVMRRTRDIRNIFKKMKQPNEGRVTLVGTILVETGQPLKKSEKMLACWKKHFEEVLNVQNSAARETMKDPDGHSLVGAPGVIWEELRRQRGSYTMHGKVVGR